MTTATLMTADELFQLPDDGWRYELVRGELRKTSPANYRHARLVARITASLANHLERERIGDVLAGDPGFRLTRDPDTVRAPDVAFVRSERTSDTERFFEGPPDVAFEVLSPNDTYSEVEEKTQDYLAAGVGVIVIVDPRRKSATIRRADDLQTVTDVIVIDDVIPGWTLLLSELFA